MKPVKTFGLAALAALMAMAFVGASSAMATGNTALCAVDGATCASPLTHVHETTPTKMEIESEENPTVKCNASFLGDALNSGLANPLVIHGNFTYTSCNTFCSVTEQNGPATLKFLRTATELATVTYEFLMYVNCFFGAIKCYYTGVGLEGHGLGALTSSPNGAITITNQMLQREFVPGDFCPVFASLTITTKPLSATYISS